MKKQIVATALGALMVLGGFVGVASAQYGGDTEPVETNPVQTQTLENESTLLQVQDTEGNTADEDTAEDEGRRGRRGCSHGTAAEAIGISEDELRAELDAGSSIADVATANGIDPLAVVDAMVDAKEEKIAAKIEAGRITQEQADEKLANAADRASNKVFGIDGEA